MGERVKKDVKILIFLALVLSLFNVLSIQFFLFDAGKHVGPESGATLPSDSIQKESLVAGMNGARKDASGNSDSEVYQYVNDKLKKYGYDSNIDDVRESVGSGSSSSSSQTKKSSNQVIYLNPTQSQQQNSSVNQQSQNTQQTTSQNNTSQQNNQQNTTNNQNQQTNNQQNNQQNNNQQTNPQNNTTTNQTAGGGLPSVPSNQTGKPATSFSGEIKFGIKSGLG